MPNHAFVAAALPTAAPAMPAAPALPTMPAAPALPTMPAAPQYVPTAAAQGHSLDTWLASYTIEQLLQHGIFTKA